MGKATSKRLTSVRAHDGQEGVLYEALAALVCRRCGRTIRIGEPFVRRLHKGDAYRQSPVCATCVGPFKPLGTDAAGRTPAGRIRRR